MGHDSCAWCWGLGSECPRHFLALLRSFSGACAQGAVGVTCRADDEATLALLAPLDHAPTRIAVMCERAMLDALDGSCRTPIAGLAEIDGETIHLRGLVARPDGSEIISGAREGHVSEAEEIGRLLGEDLKGQTEPGFFDGGH